MYREDQETELKVELTKDIKKEIVAFANTNDGTIYIGIDDNGKIIESSFVNEFKNSENRVIFKVNDTSNLPISNAIEIKKNSFVINGDKNEVAKIVKQLVKSNIEIYEIRNDEISLEEAFLKKTGGPRANINKK